MNNNAQLTKIITVHAILDVTRVPSLKVEQAEGQTRGLAVRYVTGEFDAFTDEAATEILQALKDHCQRDGVASKPQTHVASE